MLKEKKKGITEYWGLDGGGLTFKNINKTASAGITSNLMFLQRDYLSAMGEVS